MIQNYDTISIPFVQNDLQGSLTQALVNEIATQTSLTYVNSGSDLVLKVRIVNTLEEDIGFRYDQDKKGKLVHYIIPSETRLTVIARVELIDACTSQPLLGPVLIEASYEFDHDYYTSRNSVNIFSLGQLTNYDEAYDAALKPLFKNLSTKIVDYIKAIW